MVNTHVSAAKDQQNNFTQILTNPGSVLVVLPSNLHEFIASLWGLKILKQKFKDTTFLLKKEEWKFFPGILYQNTSFNFLLYDQLDNYLQHHEKSLVLLLSSTPEKILFNRLSRKNIIAGMNTCSQVDQLHIIIDVNADYSCAQNFFNFVCQICNRNVGFMEYVRTVSIKQNHARGEQVVAIDISRGIHGTRFLKKHIYAMVDFFTHKGYTRIIVLDTDKKYFKKLEKKIAQRVQPICTDEWQVLYDSLINFTVLISHNSLIAHIAQLIKLPSFIFVMPYEHKHIFGTIERARVFISSFGALSVKQLKKQLERLG